MVDPAFASKGGGQYSGEVTRGQNLTGKDCSGESLSSKSLRRLYHDKLTLKAQVVVPVSLMLI